MFYVLYLFGSLTRNSTFSLRCGQKGYSAVNMHLKNLSIIFLIIELILIRESISWPDSNDDGTTTNCISTSSLTTTTTSSPTTSAATTTPKKPEPSFNISGWDWINKTRNPSGFEEYFFTTSDINLKYKLSQQVNAAILVSKVESLKASFSYVSSLIKFKF